MSYRVANIRVNVQVGRYTSKNLYIPEYELAVLRAEHGNRVGTPSRLPKPGSKAARCAVTGRPDRYHPLRFTEIESLPLEYDRLIQCYSRPDHEEGPSDPMSAPALRAYPTLEIFVAAAKAAYPEVFGDVDIKREMILDAEDDEGDDIIPLADIPEEEDEEEDLTPAAADAYEQRGPDVSELETLPYIEHNDAVDLFNAGMISLEDVANASAEAIAAAVHGVGKTRAKQIIEAALDRTLGADNE